MSDLESWKKTREVSKSPNADLKVVCGGQLEDQVEDDGQLEEMVKREEKMLEQLEKIEKNQSGKNKLVAQKPSEKQEFYQGQKSQINEYLKHQEAFIVQKKAQASLKQAKLEEED